MKHKKVKLKLKFLARLQHSRSHTREATKQSKQLLCFCMEHGNINFSHFISDFQSVINNFATPLAEPPPGQVSQAAIIGAAVGGTIIFILTGIIIVLLIVVCKRRRNPARIK